MLQIKWFFLTLFFYSCKGNEKNIKVIPGLSIAEVENEFREQNRDIYRPCPYYDLLCIRRYLSKHSNCKIAQGPVPDPLYRAQSNLFLPTVNITLTMNGLSIGGLNGVVREFYANRKDHLTILAVEFSNVTLRSDTAVFQYQRRGQEPIITNSSTNELFPSFTTTTVFRGVDHLDLANSETTTFLNVQPVVGVDPSAAAGESSDPTIPARFAFFLANINVVAQEAFLTAGVFYGATYIQYDLCDFGLRLN